MHSSWWLQSHFLLWNPVGKCYDNKNNGIMDNYGSLWHAWISKSAWVEKWKPELRSSCNFLLFFFISSASFICYYLTTVEMCSHARIIVPIFINGTPQWVRDVPFIILEGGIEILSLFQHQLNGWWSFSSTFFFLFTVFFHQSAIYYFLSSVGHSKSFWTLVCPSDPLYLS